MTMANLATPDTPLGDVASVLPTSPVERSADILGQTAPAPTRAASARGKVGKTVLVSEPVKREPDGTLKNDDMPIFARDALGGADHRTASTWRELVTVLAEYTTIERLVLYFHGIPGSMVVGVDDEDLNKAIRLFKPGDAPTVTDVLEFENCNIAGTPIADPVKEDRKQLLLESMSKVITFAKLFRAPQFRAWNYFHLSEVITVRVPKGSSATQIEGLLAKYKDYLIPNSPTAASLAELAKRTDIAEKLMLEWFRPDYDKTSLPPPGGAVPREMKFKPRSKAQEHTYTEFNLDKLDADVGAVLEHVTVTLSYFTPHEVEHKPNRSQ
jgi:hypothetical protein